MGAERRPRGPELSIVMPCLNEVRTLTTCIAKAKAYLARCGVEGEIVIADNASTDGSREIAVATGVRVVDVAAQGYGSALAAGIAAARGRFVIMGDSDDSYDFNGLDPILTRLSEGYDLVMGNRFAGGIRPGAMPFLHRYLGNPVLSFLGRLFFGSRCGDFYCGLRGFRRDAIVALDLRTTGMEFALEMVVKAALFGLKVTEVPVPLAPDGRLGSSKLRTWRDGWRSLRFLLLYSPRWLFLYPGVALVVGGFAVGAWLLPGPRRLGGLNLDVHTLLYAMTAVFLGVQAIAFAVFTKVFAASEGLLPEDPVFARLSHLLAPTAGLVVGALLTAGGIAASVGAVRVWEARAFGDLDPFRMLRTVIPAVAALTVGFELVLASLFLSVLRLRRR